MIWYRLGFPIPRMTGSSFLNFQRITEKLNPFSTILTRNGQINIFYFIKFYHEVNLRSSAFTDCFLLSYGKLLTFGKPCLLRALFRKFDLCIPRNEMRLVPNFYIHVSVSDLYIPRIGLPIWLQQNRQTNPGNI